MFKNYFELQNLKAQFTREQVKKAKQVSKVSIFSLFEVLTRWAILSK